MCSQRALVGGTHAAAMDRKWDGRVPDARALNWVEVYYDCVRRAEKGRALKLWSRASIWNHYSGVHEREAAAAPVKCGVFPLDLCADKRTRPFRKVPGSLALAARGSPPGTSAK